MWGSDQLSRRAVSLFGFNISDRYIADVCSTCNNEQIVVSFERNDQIDVEIWETSSYLEMYTSRTSRANGNVDNGFFSGLNGDADEH